MSQAHLFVTYVLTYVGGTLYMYMYVHVCTVLYATLMS